MKKIIILLSLSFLAIGCSKTDSKSILEQKKFESSFNCDFVQPSQGYNHFNIYVPDNYSKLHISFTVSWNGSGQAYHIVLRADKPDSYDDDLIFAAVTYGDLNGKIITSDTNLVRFINKDRYIKFNVGFGYYLHPFSTLSYNISGRVYSE